jgi:hypothetical protein
MDNFHHKELAKPSYINSRLWSEMAIQSTATYISHSAYASDAPNYKPIPNAPYYICHFFPKTDMLEKYKSDPII